MILLYMLFMLPVWLGQCAAYTLTAVEVNCPITYCGCYESPSPVSLLVDCHGRSDVDVGRLTEQVDSLLSSNLTYGRLTSFGIANSPLTHVPRSVCRLTTLTRLHLDNNRLTRLPDDCLSNLTNLVNLSAAHNVIEGLQDGLFDGLDELYSINLNYNRIRSIGLRVFSASAKLPSLRYIGLLYNNLTSLEPWPYYRGIQGNSESLVDIHLERNQIRQFTNTMGYEGNCRLGIPYVRIFLNYNRLVHYMDMVNGWNVTIESFAECVNLNIDLNGLNTIYTWIYAIDNNFACDCIDYRFYQALTDYAFQAIWYFFICDYYDPQSQQWSIVNPFKLANEKFICEIPERCPPGCRCAYRPANETLHVYCSNSNLTALPQEVPDLPNINTEYKLDFSRNPRLAHLGLRNYFNNTAILDASYCGIQYINDAEWKLLSLLKNLNLNKNKIQSLPTTAALTNISTKKLTIGNNPWKCSCENEWMADWFNSISDILAGIQIFCDSPGRQKGKNMLQIPREEFCVDPAFEAVKRALTVALSSVAGVVVFLLCVGFIVYRLRVRLYTRWKFHPFDRDECLGEEMDYDVFLCCSSEDHQPYGMRVLNEIESKGYKICYHLRDFLAGEPITDNICSAIRLSKRTVCLLTENFIQSGYCMEEFNMSYHHNIVENRTKRLVVLMALRNRDDFNSDESTGTQSLRHYLRRYTYIDYAADDWLDKLVYALPLRGMNTDVPMISI